MVVARDPVPVGVEISHRRSYPYRFTGGSSPPPGVAFLGPHDLDDAWHAPDPLAGWFTPPPYGLDYNPLEYRGIQQGSVLGGSDSSESSYGPQEMYHAFACEVDLLGIVLARRSLADLEHPHLGFLRDIPMHAAGRLLLEAAVKLRPPRPCEGMLADLLTKIQEAMEQPTGDLLLISPEQIASLWQEPFCPKGGLSYESVLEALLCLAATAFSISSENRMPGREAVRATVRQLVSLLMIKGIPAALAATCEARRRQPADQYSRMPTDQLLSMIYSRCDTGLRALVQLRTSLGVLPLVVPDDKASSTPPEAPSLNPRPTEPMPPQEAWRDQPSSADGQQGDPSPDQPHPAHQHDYPQGCPERPVPSCAAASPPRGSLDCAMPDVGAACPSIEPSPCPPPPSEAISECEIHLQWGGSDTGWAGHARGSRDRLCVSDPPPWLEQVHLDAVHAGLVTQSSPWSLECPGVPALACVVAGGGLELGTAPVMYYEVTITEPCASMAIGLALSKDPLGCFVDGPMSRVGGAVFMYHSSGEVELSAPWQRRPMTGRDELNLGSGPAWSAQKCTVGIGLLVAVPPSSSGSRLTPLPGSLRVFTTLNGVLSVAHLAAGGSSFVPGLLRHVRALLRSPADGDSAARMSPLVLTANPCAFRLHLNSKSWVSDLRVDVLRHSFWDRALWASAPGDLRDPKWRLTSLLSSAFVVSQLQSVGQFPQSASALKPLPLALRGIPPARSRAGRSKSPGLESRHNEASPPGTRPKVPRGPWEWHAGSTAGSCVYADEEDRKLRLRHRAAERKGSVATDTEDPPAHVWQSWAASSMFQKSKTARARQPNVASPNQCDAHPVVPVAATGKQTDSALGVVGIDALPLPGLVDTALADGPLSALPVSGQDEPRASSVPSAPTATSAPPTLAAAHGRLHDAATCHAHCQHGVPQPTKECCLHSSEQDRQRLERSVPFWFRLQGRLQQLGPVLQHLLREDPSLLRGSLPPLGFLVTHFSRALGLEAKTAWMRERLSDLPSLSSTSTLLVRRSTLASRGSANLGGWGGTVVADTLKRSSIWRAMADPQDGAEIRGKSVTVQFEGEMGTDAGGLCSEWLRLFVGELIDCPTGRRLFKPLEDGTVYLNPLSSVPAPYNNLELYDLLGRIIGWSIHKGFTLPLRLHPVLCRLMLGKTRVSPADLLSMNDPKVSYIVSCLLDSAVRNGSGTASPGAWHVPGARDPSLPPHAWPSMIDHLEAVMGVPLTFCVMEGDAVVDLPLPPGEEYAGKLGRHVKVTEDTKLFFVQALGQWKLLDSIREPLRVLMAGMSVVLPSTLLRPFRELELQCLVAGPAEVDVTAWRESTDCRAADPVQVEWFWDIVAGMSGEERSKVLAFWTGRSTMPVVGCGHLHPLCSIIEDNAEHSDFRLPSAHTCDHQLVLPRYSSRAKMEDRLRSAILGGLGDCFGFM
eukprot:CAMPEP_0114561176 /NCGR_PEP_ID=MMETSP0114-20121206/11863_1 /TAXON_ID=31324 /ORGANISM="Goniomonas sp, Strain m" /LENGTH=1438 /DNA_ID=CAMNT_0001746791 /DNA_START=527 /DNA_END=4842 /DNA_ORIENTATION=+